MKLYDVIQKENHQRRVHTRSTEEAVEPTFVPPRHVRHATRWRKLVIVSIALLFLAVVYVVGMRFVHARVIVTERRVPFTLDGVEFELAHEGEATSGRLTFQTMMVESEVSRQVYGSQVEQSTSTAKGKVVFFNEYSTKSQTIKAKTTLTATNGKKYQTTIATTVPGYTLKGKVKTAGTSTAVPIVAIAVGPSYNTSGTSFSVSGWGKSLYAQSAGPIAGGDDGMAHSVAPSEQASVLATLQTQLVERLRRETRGQIPESFIVYPDLQVPTIDASQTLLRGDSVKFPATMKGTLTTYLVPREAFERAIAHYVLHEQAYARVTIPSIADLSITSITPLPADPKHMPDSIKVRVSGEGVIITKVPATVLSQSLLGVRGKTFGEIVNSYPEIDSAQYHVYPFWAPYFPTREDRITIQTQ